MSSLPDDLDRLIQAELRAALDTLAAGAQSAADGIEAELTYALPAVQKMSAVVPISNELAMEYGLIPDTRPPVVYTRRQRLRWWRQTKVAVIRLRLGEWIAGVSLTNEDD